MKSEARVETTSRVDVYSRVTAKIIADLERGVRTWMKPWSGDQAQGRIEMPLRHNGVAYRGINVLLLWSEAIERGYACSRWMTYRQAGELNAHVRKGERGSMVVFADMFKKTEETDAGEEIERQIPYLKAYTVFNVEQIEGLPEGYYDRPAAPAERLQLIERAEQFFRATGAAFRHGGSKAFYAPDADLIQLPVPEAFVDAESYAATKAHELTHWTKHESRLDRDFGRKHFGDAGYAREELVVRRRGAMKGDKKMSYG